MFKVYKNVKKFVIWAAILSQLSFALYYLYVGRLGDDDLRRITFISKEAPSPNYTYHTSRSRIFLKTTRPNTFIDFNSSLCYVNGTDLVSMRRFQGSRWECHCLPGWHGKDCGQPELIWRAFLTQRKPLNITGPRTFERRLLYVFKVDRFSEIFTEIRLNELADIVDLFIIYEESDTFLTKLQNQFLKDFHGKILYLKSTELGDFSLHVKNLRNDDVILTSNWNEIPNKSALSFLKLYNNWPEPFRFRYRWTVYGFFWTHPSKTVISGGLSSISYFKTALNNHFGSLQGVQAKSLVLGDLNHFGGWFCEYCNDVSQILGLLNRGPARSQVNLTRINRKTIDAEFLEDVIENGVYIDGHTELVRSRRYREPYYAPTYVLNHDWKYDFLMINLYSKMDYY